MTDADPSTRSLAGTDDPRRLAFFPLLYVAWADGDLSPEETRAICARVSATEGLERGCRDHLGGWLDPDNPPSARDLRALLTAIRRGAAKLSPDRKRSLTRPVCGAGVPPAITHPPASRP